MELQHVNVKLFVEDAQAVDLDAVVKVFHRWVSEQSMDELLIDVADYRHVPQGPGIVLVGHEADYALDNTDGICGLRYNRKAPVDGSNADRLNQAWQTACKACDLLEAEFPALKFNREQFDVFINDRALAPNTSETLAACREELDSFATSTVGAGATVTHDDSDSRRLFGVTVKAGQ